jgi:DME family drug/metabolite transporter
VLGALSAVLEPLTAVVLSALSAALFGERLGGAAVLVVAPAVGGRRPERR